MKLERNNHPRRGRASEVLRLEQVPPSNLNEHLGITEAIKQKRLKQFLELHTSQLAPWGTVEDAEAQYLEIGEDFLTVFPEERALVSKQRPPKLGGLSSKEKNNFLFLTEIIKWYPEAIELLQPDRDEFKKTLQTTLDKMRRNFRSGHTILETLRLYELINLTAKDSSQHQALDPLVRGVALSVLEANIPKTTQAKGKEHDWYEFMEIALAIMRTDPSTQMEIRQLLEDRMEEIVLGLHQNASLTLWTSGMATLKLLLSDSIDIQDNGMLQPRQKMELGKDTPLPERLVME